MHRLIKEIFKAYRYHLTKPGKQVIAMGLKLKELVIVPDPNF